MVDNLPNHVAIVMDGNGRWATARGLPRVAGHRAGLATARTIIEESATLGVKYLTLYAFSTENWQRPPDEVDYLMRLPAEFWRKEQKLFADREIRINVIGDLSALPAHTRDVMVEAMHLTQDRTKLTVNLALNYGGRAEILRAVKLFAEIDPLGVGGEKLFSECLYTAQMPDPDLFIRSGGEKRLSNFLLWQSAYAEFVFCDTYWPDYTVTHFREALADYQRRQRRRGGLC